MLSKILSRFKKSAAAVDQPSALQQFQAQQAELVQQLDKTEQATLIGGASPRPLDNTAFVAPRERWSLQFGSDNLHS